MNKNLRINIHNNNQNLNNQETRIQNKIYKPNLDYHPKHNLLLIEFKCRISGQTESITINRLTYLEEQCTL